MTDDAQAPYTPEQLALLEKHFTSATAPVFAFKDLQGLNGALSARVSRAKTGVRETFLKEFVKDGVVNVKAADRLIDEILNAIGDDSVAELEAAHVAFEGTSVLATKDWEDRRIGGSPIEKSTRYVMFNERGPDGHFPYYRDRRIMASPAASTYVEKMDFVFQTYCDLIPPMTDFIKARRPMDGVKYAIRQGEKAPIAYAECASDEERKAFRKTYREDTHTKACDTLRCMLPLATKVVMVIHGNGRYFHHALNHCYSQPLTEVRDLAAKAHGALDELIPKYVKRAAANRYQIQVRTGMQALAPMFLGDLTPRPQGAAELVEIVPDFMIGAMRLSGHSDPGVLLRELHNEQDHIMIACMLYPYARLPLGQIRDRVRHLKPEDRALVVDTYVADRQSRRDRPGRAFEAGYPYTFDLATDFGTYKDLERHRMDTQLRQHFTPMIGFTMPEELREAGCEGRVLAAVDAAKELYAALIACGLQDEAQYATLHGSTVRWVLGMNDRALQHMLELRTGPQGHASYRRLCQELHRLVAKHRPWRADVMKFVDHADYATARADSEARQRIKEAKLEAAYPDAAATSGAERTDDK